MSDRGVDEPSYWCGQLAVRCQISPRQNWESASSR
jgi:hypothetical protein